MDPNFATAAGMVPDQILWIFLRINILRFLLQLLASVGSAWLATSAFSSVALSAAAVVLAGTGPFVRIAARCGVSG